MVMRWAAGRFSPSSLAAVQSVLLQLPRMPSFLLLAGINYSFSTVRHHRSPIGFASVATLPSSDSGLTFLASLRQASDPTTSIIKTLQSFPTLVPHCWFFRSFLLVRQYSSSFRHSFSHFVLSRWASFFMLYLIPSVYEVLLDLLLMFSQTRSSVTCRCVLRVQDPTASGTKQTKFSNRTYIQIDHIVHTTQHKHNIGWYRIVTTTLRA